MIEMILAKIKIDERRSEQVIVLKEKTGNRFLPVVIGISEVQAIKLKLSGVELPRPLTHDLLLSSIQKLGGVVKQIIIDNLENNTFYAKLVVTDSKGAEVAIDARPSDSIAIALRANCPIFIAEKVLDEAGLTEEGNGQ
ncbi:MAG: bifunctional nuclease family protein [Candidatus Omnitrophica bacterium]|nr:bifunctional nuclease family protein [Candidatus Omnitrophota bacterium]